MWCVVAIERVAILKIAVLCFRNVMPPTGTIFPAAWASQKSTKSRFQSCNIISGRRQRVGALFNRIMHLFVKSLHLEGKEGRG